MGPEFDPADIDRIQLQNYALDQLVNRQVLYQTAAQLDIGFSDAEVNRRLVEVPRIRLPANSVRRFIVNSFSLWVLLQCSLSKKFSRGLVLSCAASRRHRCQRLEVVRQPLWSQRRDIACLNLDLLDYLENVEVADRGGDTLPRGSASMSRSPALMWSGSNCLLRACSRRSKLMTVRKT